MSLKTLRIKFTNRLWIIFHVSFARNIPELEATGTAMDQSNEPVSRILHS